VNRIQLSLLATAGALALAGTALAAPRSEKAAESKPVRLSGNSWYSLDAARRRASAPRDQVRPILYLRMLGELAGKT